MPLSSSGSRLFKHSTFTHGSCCHGRKKEKQEVNLTKFETTKLETFTQYENQILKISLTRIHQLVQKKKKLPEERKFSESLQEIYDALLKELCARCGEKFEPIFGKNTEIQFDTIESENKNEVNTLDLEKKISEMKLTNETLTKRKEEVEQQLTKVKDEQKRLDDSNKKYQYEVQSKTAELNEIKEKMKKLEHELKKEKENQVGKAKDQVETKVDNNLQNKIMKLEEQIANMTNTFEKEKSDLNVRLQQEISKIKQQLDEKNKSYDKETSERKAIEKENLELAKKKTSLEQEVHELKSNKSTQDTNKEQITRLTNENERYKKAKIILCVYMAYRIYQF
ncbi:unnamed protein product [Mytilus edulis]|uniref:Uncharacterized protein n=1 Tax=Mytilus edulis TaxID=6550 RepID=A0A8S3S9M8_MYTED|nr:unnamed protein product [Mytilus edulis]